MASGSCSAEATGSYADPCSGSAYHGPGPCLYVETETETETDGRGRGRGRDHDRGHDRGPGPCLDPDLCLAEMKTMTILLPLLQWLMFPMEL